MATSHHTSLVRGRLPRALHGVAAGVVGMSERAAGEVHRRQPAGSLAPLVLSFGEPLEVTALSESAGAGRGYGSFVAGFSPGHASTRFSGGQDCVQVYLTPLGVGRVLRVPGGETARQVVALADLAPALGDALADRLASLTTWDERFAVVGEILLRRVADAPGPPGWVNWMWHQLVSSGGQVRIGDLVAETGWSHRHAAGVFAHHVGLTPKQAASVIRFERATADLGRLPPAQVATRHGYADQSHLSRATARHAGETPGQLAVARRPTPLTALGRAWPA